MVDILERHGGIVTQFQGDAILATFNVPLADPAHATNALGAALEMQQAVRMHRFAGESLVCRIGINTGQVVAGAVGARGRLSYTVHGDAVNVAARVEELTRSQETALLATDSLVQKAKTEGADISALEKFAAATPIRGRLDKVGLWRIKANQLS